MMIFLTDNLEILNSNQVGGKANNLAKLIDLGFNVPSFGCLPYSFIESQVQTTNSKEYQASIAEIVINSNAIEQLITKIGASPEDFFAVRSSALEEDGKEQSFAGQFDSYLYVSSIDISARIKDVWMSACSEHIQTYLSTNNLTGIPRVAVVVQKMVKATKAGVAFGADPTTGNRKGKIISSVYGLGEGLVSGELNADTYSFNGESWTKTIVDKPVKLDYSLEENSVIKSNVDPALSKTSSLNDEEIALISSKLDQLKKELLVPQDIEFAFDDNEFYLLQTRPITSLGKVADKNDQYIVWDNSNIIESYPGVTTPLTFSFIRKMYEAVYIQFCDLMGVSKSDIEENKEVFANMLGLLNGRVYYNLLSWYKVLALLPGYSVMRRLWRI